MMRHVIAFSLAFLLAPAAFAQQSDVLFPGGTGTGLLREYRAVWLTTLNGLDWPKTRATSPAGVERQRAELCARLDELQAAGINTVLLQTRIRGTVAYPSAIEPWDGAFTGIPGRDPGYDPLQFALDECHKRGMELHAWVVAFPVCKVAVAKALGRRALPSLHPELCQRAGDQYLMNPGVPATATYLAALCREIVERYEVDGIHLDYIRYPERGIPWDDSRTYRRYGSGGKTLAAWRRENVTACVRAVHDAVKAVRPWVKLSCSPVGKYADLPRQSARGWNARDAVGQDAVQWLREGIMDVLFPMMYFDGQDFYPFALDWTERASSDCIVPGLGIYFLHPAEGKWELSVIERQMNFIRSQSMGGYAMFRSQFLTDNVKGILDWTRSFNARPALPPAMANAPDTLPQKPSPAARIVGRHVLLEWSGGESSARIPVHYNVYRCMPDSSLVPIALRCTTTFLEYSPALPALLHAAFAVTAMDAYGRESEPAWVCARQ